VSIFVYMNTCLYISFIYGYIHIFVHHVYIFECKNICIYRVGDEEKYLNRLVALFTVLARELDRLALALEKAAFLPPPLENQNNRSGIKGSAKGKITPGDRSRGPSNASISDINVGIEVAFPIG
jgi:hypothetical protein